MAALADAAGQLAARGYTAFKTNIIWPGEPSRRITQGRTGPHDQLATRDIIKQAVAQIATMREAVGPDIDICLDVNVNFKPTEALRLARELEPYRLYWLEIDNQDPRALAQLRAAARTPICSGEQLLTALPEITDGHMKIPTAPGWGTELNEKAARTYAWTA